METIKSINLITTDPTVRNGQPCIGGTGIRVADIVIAHLFHARTPDALTSEYDLSLAQVHAALAYYYEHKQELDEDIRQQITTTRRKKEKSTAHGTSLLSG